MFSPRRRGAPALGADAERRPRGHRRPAAVGVPGGREASAHLQLAEERPADDARGEFRLLTLSLFASALAHLRHSAAAPRLPVS